MAVRKTLAGSAIPGSPGAFCWGGQAGTRFVVDPKEELVALFFTHVSMLVLGPHGDLQLQFEKMAFEALE